MTNGDCKFRPKRVSILPGVTEINGLWLRYLGISQSELKEGVTWTRALVTREIAVLAGGGIAEHLVTQNEENEAGVSNDIERATKLARSAVLLWGLSKNWGWTSVKDYKDLSETQKNTVDRQVRTLLKEGIDLARKAIAANFEKSFLPLGVLLAEKGDLKQEELLKFYETHPILLENDRGFKARAFVTDLLLKVHDLMSSRKSKRDQEFTPAIQLPRKVANIEEVTSRERQSEVQKVVPHPSMLRRVVNFPGVLLCRPLFR